MKLCSHGEGAKDVEGREIEMKRRMTGNSIRRVHAEVVRCPIHKMNYVRVCNDHTLRIPSRAGGIKNVRNVVRAVLILKGSGRATLQVRPAKDGGKAITVRRRRIIHPPHVWRFRE